MTEAVSLKRWTAVLLLLSCSSLAGAAAQADLQRMEEIALGWFTAHNSADIERMATFRRAHRVDQGDDWRASFPGLVERLGQLEVTGVLIERPGEIICEVESPSRGPLRFTFNFSAADGERIDSIDIDRNAPNPLPPLELPSADWSERQETLDHYLRELAENDLFAGAVLVAEGDNVRFEGAYGLASREYASANTLATRFDIGSITKDFTRVAIAQLAAAGQLGLDDTIGRHLPEYPNEAARETVTVRHLFEHRSGIGDYFTDEWAQTPMGALRDHGDYIAIWGPKPLLFEPGGESSYSNFGFTVLGAIIEAASGMSYFDYVAEKVFTPAGMTTSGFFETDAVVSDVATGYTRMERGGTRGDVLRKNIYLEPAKGGPWGKTYSTAGDLLRFWTALRRHQLTPPDYTRWVLLDGPPPPEAAADSAPVMEIGLGGGGPGMAAEIEAFDGWVIIVLANLDPPAATQVRRRLAEAL